MDRNTQRPATTEVDEQAVTADVSSLATLTARVEATSEVRTELVEQVSRRLAAGFYESQAATEQTIEAMLMMTEEPAR